MSCFFFFLKTVVVFGKVLQVPASIADAVGNRDLFLVAGTMRPETM
jgi:hypothetical protein